MVMEE